jgi:carbonic anhydrase/acetyltransferase-like protein (isoleucine patch superfamily)
LATGSTVFHGAQVGARSEIRANGIVYLRTVLAAGTTVPLGWVAVGDPAAILPTIEQEQIPGCRERERLFVPASAAAPAP